MSSHSTVWITAVCHYEAIVNPEPLVTPIQRSHGAVMFDLWHRVIPREYGDITPDEAHKLWHLFQSEPKSTDLALTMMKRRVSKLWVEYLSMN
jgi:hypothetical protein